MSIAAKYSKSDEAKAAGWFSRRHADGTAHWDESRAQQDKRNKKKMDVEIRLEQWQALSPQEQLQALDRRLGHGLGAMRQRARIMKQIKNNEKSGA